MRILTCREAAEAIGGSASDPQSLIQRAGYAVAQFCLAQFTFRSVCVVCGTGNNGAVGVIAAGVLESAAETVSVVILARRDGDTERRLAASFGAAVRLLWIADETGFDGDDARAALGADLVLDAVIATGFRPPLRGLARKAVAAINQASGIVVSVDVPSGVDPDSAAAVVASGGDMVFAHAIIGLIAPKPAHVFGELTTGPIAVSEIGAQPAFVAGVEPVAVTTGQAVGIVFPRRPRDAQAELFGHVLVIAGSRGEAGSAALAGLGALTAGAGRVTVACPASIEAVVAGLGAALMTRGLPETDGGSIALLAEDRIDALLADKDAVVVGPGLSPDPATTALIRRVTHRCRLPLVLDGNGPAAFAGQVRSLQPAPGTEPGRILVLRPDQAARLIGCPVEAIAADRLKAARMIAGESGACTVLKGGRTVIVGASGETWINSTGGPALAKEGIGDVLAGMIGAALARRRDRTFHTAFFQDVSVAAAIHLHGLAGDIAREALHEHTVMATDVLEALAAAFRNCDLQLERGLFYLQT